MHQTGGYEMSDICEECIYIGYINGVPYNYEKMKDEDDNANY